MTEELKPCPFCGNSRPAMESTEAGTLFWVTCCECLADSPPKKTEAEARAAWNRRTAPSGAIGEKP